MMFKNSCKLLCANFVEVWKLLVYHIISIAFCVGLVSIFYNDIVGYLKVAFEQAGIVNALSTGTFFGSSFSNALTSVVDFFVIFFKVMFADNIGIGIYFCFIVFLLLPLLMNMGKVVTCELMYGYMSACQKQSFTGTFLKTLKTSLSYSIVKVFYSIPFNFLTILSMWLLTRVNNNVFDYILPFAFVIIPALFMAFKETFNVGWAPAKVVYDQNVFKSYSIGMRAGLRSGTKVFSNAFVIYLLALILTMVLGIYAIIVILPILSPLLHIFEMVSFFSSQGMRYYVDSDTILAPKRLEEIDKLDDAKYIL